jgi:hypothetical protein
MPLNEMPREVIRRRTICEVLRMLYRRAEERGHKVDMDLLNEAEHYAKRMDEKLKEYARAAGKPDYRPELFGPKEKK